MAAHPTQENPSLTIERHYTVPPEKVWRAWTDPQALSRWFGPGGPNSVSLAELDLRVGGRWRIAFSTPDGEKHGVSGTYEVVEPHRKLSFTWAWQSTPERVSLVTIEFSGGPGGTDMQFRHERFFDEQARTNHQRGWTVSIARLDDFLRQ